MNRRPALRISSGKEKLKEAVSDDVIKAAERVALSAFASGLRMAAVFGTVAAKTTSIALASLAEGAGKFSELVKKEAIGSSSRGHASSRRPSLSKPETGSKRRRKRR